VEIYKNLSLEDLDKEIWKNIDGYDGDYFISNFGRIKSFKRYLEGKILNLHKNNYGYFRVSLYRNKKVKYKEIHILMYESFIEEIPKGCVVHHIDFIKENNILDNFQLMTKSEHRIKHNEGENHPMFGKHHSEKTKQLISEHHANSKGENNPNSVLTEQIIIQIRKYLNEGILTQKEISKMFGVSISIISRIKNNNIWKHINKGVN